MNSAIAKYRDYQWLATDKSRYLAQPLPIIVYYYLPDLKKSYISISCRPFRRNPHSDRGPYFSGFGPAFCKTILARIMTCFNQQKSQRFFEILSEKEKKQQAKNIKYQSNILELKLLGV